MKEVIASLQNPRIKHLRKLLDKSSERREQELFVIEGAREVSLAQAAGISFRAVFFCEDLADPGLVSSFDSHLLTGISRSVFEKLAYREHSGGLLALAEPASLRLKDLELPERPFLIVLEAVEKPGNLGAVLRTADAARADAVIICDPRTDIYNPNVIRSSVGCVFTTRVLSAASAEVLDFFREKGIKSYAAALTASRYYYEADFRGACAVIMGTESTGLSDQWLSESGGRIEQIKIPMRGQIDSLNVSTSCAIITFEAMRQRGFR